MTSISNIQLILEQPVLFTIYYLLHIVSLRTIDFTLAFSTYTRYWSRNMILSFWNNEVRSVVFTFPFIEK